MSRLRRYGSLALVLLVCCSLVSGCSRAQVVGVQQADGSTLTVFVPLCREQMEVTSVTLEYVERGANGVREVLWHINDRDGFGSTQEFVVGASADGPQGPPDPAISVVIGQRNDDARNVDDHYLLLSATDTRGHAGSHAFLLAGSDDDLALPADETFDFGAATVDPDRGSLVAYQDEWCNAPVGLTNAEMLEIGGVLWGVGVVSLGFMSFGFLAFRRLVRWWRARQLGR